MHKTPGTVYKIGVSTSKFYEHADRDDARPAPLALAHRSRQRAPRRVRARVRERVYTYNRAHL